MFVKVWRNRRRSHQTVHDDLEMVAAQKTQPLFDDRKKMLVSSLEFNEYIVSVLFDRLACLWPTAKGGERKSTRLHRPRG